MSFRFGRGQFGALSGYSSQHKGSYGWLNKVIPYGNDIEGPSHTHQATFWMIQIHQFRRLEAVEAGLPLILTLTCNFVSDWTNRNAIYMCIIDVNQFIHIPLFFILFIVFNHLHISISVLYGYDACDMQWSQLPYW